MACPEEFVGNHEFKMIVLHVTLDSVFGRFECKYDLLFPRLCVAYHPVHVTSRRARIGYENTEPIAYEVFRSRIALERAQ